MSERAGVLRGVVGSVVVAALWFAFASSAWGHWGNAARFGSGDFRKPVGITVDQSAGDVFVGSLFGSGISKFDSSHALLSQFGAGTGWISGVAVDPTSHDLYAVDALAQEIQTYEPGGGELLSSFSVAGAGAGNIFGGSGIDVQIAADANGNVYLPNAPHNEVQVFGPEGGAPAGGVAAAIAGEGAHAISGPTGVAVDSSGHVWVADDGNGRVEEFEPNGEFVREISAPGAMAVAVDSKGDVFVSVEPESGAHVLEFNAAGEQIDDFGLGVLGEEMFGEPAVLLPNPIVLDEADGIFYAADPANKVGWAFTPIGAETREATKVTSTSATLNGAVNPQEAAVTGCEFEYATEADYKVEQHYSHSIACAQEPGSLGSGNAPVPVSAEIGGLEIDEIYHFRLHARNEAGQAFGGDQTFVAVEPIFGFQLSGPNALKILVSDEADEKEPAAGSPTALDSQAGSHPFDVTTRFLINTESNKNLPADLQPKDYYVNIPAGFAGSVAKVPRCKMSELSSLTNRQRPPGCPTASQVGVVRLFRAPLSGTPESEPVPVYNMVPPPGVPAEFAFPYIEIGEPIVFQLRSDGDYGVTAKIRNISEAAAVTGSQLTLWGVPADPRHDPERFLPARGSASNIVYIPGDAEGKPLPAGTAEVPFLTNPTKCGAQNEATITADSWLRPGQLAEDGLPVPGGEGWVSANTPMFPNGITGCEKLTFHPEMEVKPDTTVADSPTGLTVDLRVPQSEGPNNLATPALKDATVRLPQGLSISPSQANGLEGCTPEEIALGTMKEPSCPNASQVGKLELVTATLPEPLEGRIYLSSEREGSTFHIYLVIEGQGVLIKLKGTIVANEQTGQLTSTFDENPQLPFSELKLTFYGGNTAALATPSACGSYQTTSLLEPWSHEPAEGEARGTPNAEPAVEPFQISSDCARGFTPGFRAGTANPVAGAFSPLSLTVSRNDGEQELEGLRITLPKGLVGKLAGVAQCSDAQIAHAAGSTGTAEQASPSCPASSLLGTVQAGSGPGGEPFFVPGRAYLTGPYEGAPYGVVVIVPVLAGPFDLGTVVVRSRIDIDPHTAQVTVTSDPLPRMLDGIPLRMRRTEVSVSRPKFTLNPTSCEPTKVTGLLSSFDGGEHGASARFQVGDCASLAFKPGFKVTTHARHTRRSGAYLRVNVTSGPGQANLRSVLVKLPKALPSRLSTLKQACSEAQFKENPAGCPATSRVGTAIARTPILSVPLSGPAIFVSHGGAAFPDLDVVLQGAGITVELEGNTNIHNDVTISTFKALPDVPVNSFQLTLPTGPHSALAGTGSFCFKTVTRHKRRVRRRVKLVMPTTITGQNGKVVKQNTIVAVQGCASKHHKHR